MQPLRSKKPMASRIWMAVLAAMLCPVLPAAAGTLDRVKTAGKIVLGYETDARPFSYQDEAGKPAGYAVALCQKVADEVKAALALPNLAVEWVPIKVEDRFQAVKQGTADLLCGSDSVTLTRRKDVDFSIPIFPGGIGAVLGSDASPALREILEQGSPSPHPIWRGSPARTVLEQKKFSVVAGTTSEIWLKDRLNKFQLSAEIVPVESYAAGIERVVNGSTNVLFGDLPILLDASKRSASSRDLIVLTRHFTYEPLALAMQRGDDDFRLLVDGALSRTYQSDGFRDFFVEWFGPPAGSDVSFFQQTALPE